MGSRRPFGKLRRLTSGRWQASYIHPSTGSRVFAPATFPTKADANVWLSTVQTDLARGEQLAVETSTVVFSEYAEQWLSSKSNLRPTTSELYGYLLRVHIVPVLGRHRVTGITSADIRKWHSGLVSSGLSPTSAAKAYRLVRQILEAAVDDRIRRDNPCRIRGAAVERSPERKIPSVEDVVALADAIAPRYRAMVLLAAFAGLRRGECLGLARRHVDMHGEPATVAVERSVVLMDRGAVMQAPKTVAGYRTVALPQGLARELAAHLDSHVEPGPDSLLFTDASSATSPTKDRMRWEWELARRGAGVSCSFHDLRHVAGTLNAAAGATIKEAMARLGHASPVAALRYQHAVHSRDAEIASLVDRLVSPSLGNQRPDLDG